LSVSDLTRLRRQDNHRKMSYWYHYPPQPPPPPPPMYHGNYYNQHEWMYYQQPVHDGQHRYGFNNQGHAVYQQYASDHGHHYHTGYNNDYYAYYNAQAATRYRVDNGHGEVYGNKGVRHEDDEMSNITFDEDDGNYQSHNGGVTYAVVANEQDSIISDVDSDSQSLEMDNSNDEEDDKGDDEDEGTEESEVDDFSEDEYSEVYSYIRNDNGVYGEQVFNQPGPYRKLCHERRLRRRLAATLKCKSGGLDFYPTGIKPGDVVKLYPELDAPCVRVHHYQHGDLGILPSYISVVVSGMIRHNTHGALAVITGTSGKPTLKLFIYSAKHNMEDAVDPLEDIEGQECMRDLEIYDDCWSDDEDSEGS
jgi:hypothetical protein